MMAQRTADDHVSDARREADKLLSDARSKAEEVTREARAKADALERDARQRHQEAMGGLDAKRTALQKHIEELKQFEREYRTRLKAYLESQLRDLDGRGQGLEAEMTRADGNRSVAGHRWSRRGESRRLLRRGAFRLASRPAAEYHGTGAHRATDDSRRHQAAGVSRDRRKSAAHPRRGHAARARPAQVVRARCWSARSWRACWPPSRWSSVPARRPPRARGDRLLTTTSGDSRAGDEDAEQDELATAGRRPARRREPGRSPAGDRHGRTAADVARSRPPTPVAGQRCADPGGVGTGPPADDDDAGRSAVDDEARRRRRRRGPAGRAGGAARLAGRRRPGRPDGRRRSW